MIISVIVYGSRFKQYILYKISIWKLVSTSSSDIKGVARKEFPWNPLESSLVIATLNCEKFNSRTGCIEHPDV